MGTNSWRELKRQGDRQQRDGGRFENRLGPKLREAMKGPDCLHCKRPIDLRRQGSPNGYLHSACERAQPMPQLHAIMYEGDDHWTLLSPLAGLEFLGSQQVAV